jgi:hypothetical protein
MEKAHKKTGEGMKITQTKQTEIQLNNRGQIEGVKIGDKAYTLTISQTEYGQGSGKYTLTFTFGDDDFHIQISQENTITMSRQVHRPSHDHNDMEYLQAKEGEDKSFYGSWPYKGRGNQLVEIPFGPETVGY